ncbi:Rz-like lysis system protein LysB [Pseudomonas protegens]|uniref:Rz-like lysis system protein LysB n=1 Tax=Pseudomonas protegens TaxID=380021 RepID=UPI002937048E|nr:Rz-like lysis system protein LysB [Pseudomonas protegens]WOE81639.1 Rz-like lysis system protein LysB [Pseudomonas protegens]
MSTIRQILLGLALVGVLGLLLWGQQQRIEVADKNRELAEKDTRDALAAARRSEGKANALEAALSGEREAQTRLRTEQDLLRQGLAKRQLTIEGLKRENADLRAWADQPLPDVARRLRERPALTGADAYRQWLSGRGALQPASDQPKQ